MHLGLREAIVLAVFAATYVLISIPKIPGLNLDRTTAALAGAALLILSGGVTLKDAYAAIDLNTITLLLGMMMLVSFLKMAHFFEWSAYWVLFHAKTPRRLLALVILGSGLLSPWLVNDTICLMVTPILLGMISAARLNPVPYLLALVTSANIGSAMTWTGNPQNMLVGIFSGIPFSRYFIWALPASLVGLWIDYLWIAFLFRREIGLPAFDLPNLTPPYLDRPNVRRILIIIGTVVLAFLLPLEKPLHISPGEKLPLFAIVGGVVAILVGRYRPTEVLRHVDGGLLLFFASLFVVVRAVEQTGLLSAGFVAAAPLMGNTTLQQSSILTCTTLLLSNVVSNVPFVLVAKEWMLSPGRFADPELAWALLAYVSTLAGNATILGSVANLIVLELARDHARIGFWAYARVGIPLTILTTLAGVPLLILLRSWVG